MNVCKDYQTFFCVSDGLKLILPGGIPSSLTDLNCAIRDSFDIPGDSSVLYQDMDFSGQFFTLSSIGNLEDKATLKVVPVKSVVLTLSPVETIVFDSPPSRESSDTISPPHHYHTPPFSPPLMKPELPDALNHGQPDLKYQHFPLV